MMYNDNNNNFRFRVFSFVVVPYKGMDEVFMLINSDDNDTGLGFKVSFEGEHGQYCYTVSARQHPFFNKDATILFDELHVFDLTTADYLGCVAFSLRVALLRRFKIIQRTILDNLLLTLNVSSYSTKEDYKYGATNIHPYTLVTSSYVDLRGNLKVSPSGSIQYGLFLVLAIINDTVIAAKVTSQDSKFLNDYTIKLPVTDFTFLKTTSYLQLDKLHTLSLDECSVIGSTPSAASKDYRINIIQIVKSLLYTIEDKLLDAVVTTKEYSSPNVRERSNNNNFNLNYRRDNYRGTNDYRDRRNSYPNNKYYR